MQKPEHRLYDVIRSDKHSDFVVHSGWRNRLAVQLRQECQRRYVDCDFYICSHGSMKC